MKKQLIISPSFGAFRAYEPVAFELAEQAVYKENKTHFTRLTDAGRVIAKGNKIIVELHGVEDPFYFDLISVED